MMDSIRIVVGFDQEEAIAYHTFSQSLIDHSTAPLQITPLAHNNLPFFRERSSDASNKFVYSRFLTPFLMNFDGWAIFADGDMICTSDIAELWSLRDPTKAVMVAKHSYTTKFKSFEKTIIDIFLFGWHDYFQSRKMDYISKERA